MKQILLILSLYITISHINAQYLEVPYNLPTPFTGIFTEERFKGERIDWKSHEINNFGETEEFEGVIIYTRSKDGLRDTLYIGSGIARDEERVYSADGKLITYKEDLIRQDQIEELGYDANEVFNYSYDSMGRILRIDRQVNNPDKFTTSTIYDYDNNQIRHIEPDKNNQAVETITYIHYTDSGYQCIHNKDTIEYVFDKKNRLICKKDVPEKEYATSVINYSYTDNGYIKYTKDFKEEYTFSKSGYQIARYALKENGEYKLTSQTEATYLYKDDPQSNVILDNQQSVYGTNGAIIVLAETGKTIHIYNLNGQLVKKADAQSGTSIPMSPGIYIVISDNQPYKIRVK